MQLGNYKILFIKLFFFFALIIPKHIRSFESPNIDQHLKYSVEIFEHCLIRKSHNQSASYDNFITILVDPLTEGSNVNLSQKAEIFFLSQTLWSYFNNNVFDTKNKQVILSHWLKLGQQWEAGAWASNLDIPKKTLYFDGLLLCQQELQKDKFKSYVYFNELYKKSTIFLKNFIPAHYKNSKEFSTNQLKAIQSAADVINTLSMDLIPNSLSPVVLTNDSNQSASISSRSILSFLWNWWGSKETVAAHIIPQAPKLIDLPPKKYMRALPLPSVQELNETREKMGLIQRTDEEGINEISISPSSVQNQNPNEKKLADPILNNLSVATQRAPNSENPLMGQIRSFSFANLKIKKMQKVKKVQTPEEHFLDLQNDNEALAALVEKIFIRTNEKLKEVQSSKYYGHTTRDVYKKIFRNIKHFLSIEEAKRLKFLEKHKGKLNFTRKYLENRIHDGSKLNNLWTNHSKSNTEFFTDKMASDLTESISVSSIKPVWDKLTDKTKSEIFASEIFVKLCDPKSDSTLVKSEKEFKQLKNLFALLSLESNTPSDKFPWLVPQIKQEFSPEQTMFQSLVEVVNSRRIYIEDPYEADQSSNEHEWGDQ